VLETSFARLLTLIAALEQQFEQWVSSAAWTGFSGSKKIVSRLPLWPLHPRKKVLAPPVARFLKDIQGVLKAVKEANAVKKNTKTFTNNSAFQSPQKSSSPAGSPKKSSRQKKNNNQNDTSMIANLNLNRATQFSQFFIEKVFNYPPEEMAQEAKALANSLRRKLKMSGKMHAYDDHPAHDLILQLDELHFYLSMK
jgi:hypothetical protein